MIPRKVGEMEEEKSRRNPAKVLAETLIITPKKEKATYIRRPIRVVIVKAFCSAILGILDHCSIVLHLNDETAVSGEFALVERANPHGHLRKKRSKRRLSSVRSEHAAELRALTEMSAVS